MDTCWYPSIAINILGFPRTSLVIREFPKVHPWMSTWTSMEIYGYPQKSMYMDRHASKSMAIRGYPWIPMDIFWYPWLAMDIQRFPWIPMKIRREPRISMRLHELLWMWYFVNHVVFAHMNFPCLGFLTISLGYYQGRSAPGADSHPWRQDSVSKHGLSN